MLSHGERAEQGAKGCAAGGECQPLGHVDCCHREGATARPGGRLTTFSVLAGSYASGFAFNSVSCSLMNVRISSAIASSFVHCSL